MSRAEAFRIELQKRTPEAVKAVKGVYRNSRDPRIQREAFEYLNNNKKRSNA